MLMLFWVTILHRDPLCLLLMILVFLFVVWQTQHLGICDVELQLVRSWWFHCVQWGLNNKIVSISDHMSILMIRPNLCNICLFIQLYCLLMHESKKFRQRGSNNFDNVFTVSFFITWWRERASKYHFKRPPWAFHWRADDGPTLNAGLAELFFFF